ncbi:MAG: N-acetylglucosamine-6-phosphate deacetylase [Bacteroidetes bacterium]|nr:MAG: N-acetylglucosamine-6-phosphate deacetylase [Bacteroidota bacterium]
MNLAFKAREIFTGHELRSGQTVLVRNKKIEDIVPSSAIPANFHVRDFSSLTIAPALIDLQIYGGNGKLFSAELTTESLDATYEYCLQGGCTHFMITMATNSMEKFKSGIRVVGQYLEMGGKGLLGLHLEGPYINPAKKGAHIEKFIKKPTIDEVKMILEKGKGIIKMMTLAPECCDKEIVDLLLENNILVSAGHSNATYQQAINGFYMGIPAATHLFNAMSPFQGREPGMVGAIYDHQDVVASVVCDGVHVDFASIRISKKLLGERLFFITDAVAEITHGEYQHIFKNDRYTLPDGTLSGSALTMWQVIKNAVEKVGIPVHEALRMGSLYPGRLLKEKKFGLIEKGADANFIAFDDALNLQQVIVDGE